MKTNRFLTTTSILWGVAATALGQSTNLHRFSAIDLRPDHTISFTLTSGVPSAFRNYFDLFPVEVSSNLTDWQPLVTLLRTNKSTNALTYTDLDAGKLDQQFYHTPTNQLITPIPRPSGPYTIGTVSRLFTDLSRTNRYNIKTNSSFMAQFWYPAVPKAGVLPAPYIDRRIAATWANESSDLGVYAALYRSAVSHALPDLTIATNEAPFALVIFSHGYQEVCTIETDVMENLASHGYITVAIDHADVWASVFPSGEIVQGNAPGLPVSLTLNALFLQGRTRDVQFVLDELTRLNREDDFFRGRLDLQHVGIFGHSFGGAITADICAADNRFKAGLSLDGGGHTNLLALQIDQPFLIASGDDANPTMQPFRVAFRSLFDQFAHDAYWFHLKNSEHYDFVEMPWFAATPAPAKLRTAIVLRRYILSFFNKYLKGQDDHFLDGPPSDYPEVDVFLKK